MDMGRKLGTAAPSFMGRGAGYPSNTKSPGHGLPANHWHLNQSSDLVTTDMGRKLGGCARLGEGSWIPI